MPRRSWNRMLVAAAMLFAVAGPAAVGQGAPAAPAPVRPTSVDG